MNPAYIPYILPTFLGVCCAGLVIWNVRMTGTISSLEIKLETALNDNETYQGQVETLNELYAALSKTYINNLMRLTELETSLGWSDTTIKGYQQDVDTLREERRIQEASLDLQLAQNIDLVQTIADQERTIKDFTGMINTLNSKIPKRDESGKFKKKK